MKPTFNLDRINPYVLAAGISCLIAGFILFFFIGQPGHIIYYDVTEGINPNTIVQRYFYTFDDNSGATLAEQARIPLFSLIWVVFKALQLPFETFIKIKIFLLYFLSIAAFVYCLKILNKHFKILYAQENRIKLLIVLIAASLIYVFNPWMTNRITHFFFFFASVNLPLVFALYLDFLLNKNLKLSRLIILAIVMAFTLATPHTVIFDGFLILLISLVVLFLPAQENLHKKRLKYLPLLGVITILLNFYWILPYLSTGGAPPDRVESLDILTLLARNANLENALRLIGYWWIDPGFYFNLGRVWPGFFTIASYILPLTFLAFVTIYRQKLIPKILAALFLVSLFFTSLTKTSSIFYNYLLFDSPIQSFGWLFREIDKFGIILVLVYSIGAVYFLGFLLKKRVLYPLLILFVVGLGFFFGVHFVNIMDKNYQPQNVPLEFSRVNEFLQKDPQNFNVIWYPGESFPNWATTKDNPQSLAHLSSSKAIFNTTSQTTYLISYLFDEKNIEQINLAKALNVFGVKYVVIRDDGTDISQQPLVKTLERKKELNLILQDGVLSVFGNPHFTELSNTYNKQIKTNLGLEIFKRLDSLNLDPSQTLINFLDTPDSSKINLPTEKIILDQDDLADLVFTQFTQNLIFPFDFSIRTQPLESWAKASLTDLTHAESHFYLENENIYNAQFDYGQGVVLAKEEWQLKTNLQTNDLLRVKDTSLKVNFPKDFNIQENFSRQYLEFNYQFDPETELNPYWKIVQSDLINVDLFKALFIQLNFDLSEKKQLLDPHVKITYFDTGGNSIKTQHLIANYQNQIRSLSKVPLNAKNAQISFWTKTTKNPYQINVKNFRLLDISSYVEPIQLGFATENKCSSNCLLFGRILKSDAGGQIRLKVEDRVWDIPTKSHENRFQWINIGRIDTPPKNISFHLTNQRGFNAVNAFVLVENDQLENAIQKAQTELITTPQSATSYLQIALPFIAQISKQNPTLYEFELHTGIISRQTPVILDFKKPYDPSWRLKTNQYNIYQNSKPIIVSGFINGWVLEENELPTTISYYPQKFFVLGSIITVLTLLLLGIFKTSAIFSKTVLR